MTFQRAFGNIPLTTERAEKPRNTGLTMMIDWGLPLGQQKDISESNGHFIDLAKIAVGQSGVIDAKHLQAKVSAYQTSNIEPFPGGMFLEYALHLGKEKEYWEGCQKAGYRLIEVSDNAIPLEAKTKTRLITEANNLGMKVLGEVGSKHDLTPVDALIADVTNCLDSGSWKVFIEAAELIDNGELRTDLIEAIQRDLDGSRLIWELPGSWIPDTHECDVHELAVWLIESLGPEANIANVMPEWIVELETLRTGVGVRTLVKELEETKVGSAH
jgi:phosphosulfolactate synthase